MTPDRMRQLRGRGVAVAQIALAAGLSARRVYQILGVSSFRPRITPSRRAEVQRLHASSLSRREIARRLAMSRKTVDAILALAPAPAARTARRAVPWTPQDIEHVRSRTQAGHSVGTITRELDRPSSSVQTLIRRHNWT